MVDSSAGEEPGGVRPIRVLYSFPYKIGADRICETAWQQAAGVSAAGARVLVLPGAVARPLPAGVHVSPTLARGPLRIPYRLVGNARALAFHDRIVARRLPSLADRIDVVHTWPSSALATLRTARALGIPTVLERPNAHTRFAYEVVRRESERIGVPIPPGHDHAYDAATLQLEEEEFRLADRLLCPSDFVMRSFLDEGFAPEKLVRDAYGFDEGAFHPASIREQDADRPLTLLFAGVAAVRKGLHFALAAWLRSPASRRGQFLVAGTFLPAYEAKLAPMLEHPSVQRLGQRDDLPELMRNSDVLVLPTIEEGSPLVVLEALGSGCVPVVSDVCASICRHMENALVHRVGDVETLARHITLLDEERGLLERLRGGAIESAPEHTWSAAGRKLLEVYRELVAAGSPGRGEAGFGAGAV